MASATSSISKSSSAGVTSTSQPTLLTDGTGKI